MLSLHVVLGYFDFFSQKETIEQCSSNVCIHDCNETVRPPQSQYTLNLSVVSVQLPCIAVSHRVIYLHFVLFFSLKIINLCHWVAGLAPKDCIYLFIWKEFSYFLLLFVLNIYLDYKCMYIIRGRLVAVESQNCDNNISAFPFQSLLGFCEGLWTKQVYKGQQFVIFSFY